MSATESIGPPSRAPVAPTGNVRQELERALDADSSFLGEVFWSLRDGMTPNQIHAARGATTSGFVWSYQRAHTALLDGDLPTAHQWLARWRSRSGDFFVGTG